MREAIYDIIKQMQELNVDYLTTDEKLIIEKAINILQQESNRIKAERKKIKQHLEKLVGENINVMLENDLIVGTLTKVKGSFATFENITTPTNMQGRTWYIDTDVIIRIGEKENDKTEARK